MTIENEPVHPGKVIFEQIINANDLTKGETAEYLGITKAHLSYILHGKRTITAEMCNRIATVFGGDAEQWASIQSKYSLATTADKVKRLNLKPYRPK